VWFSRVLVVVFEDESCYCSVALLGLPPDHQSHEAERRPPLTRRPSRCCNAQPWPATPILDALAALCPNGGRPAYSWPPPSRAVNVPYVSRSPL